MLNNTKKLNTQNKIYAIIDEETELVVNVMICINEKEAIKNMKQALRNIEKMNIDLESYKLIELDLYQRIELKDKVLETLEKLDKEINEGNNE